MCMYMLCVYATYACKLTNNKLERMSENLELERIYFGLTAPWTTLQIMHKRICWHRANVCQNNCLSFMNSTPFGVDLLTPFIKIST